MKSQPQTSRNSFVHCGKHVEHKRKTHKNKEKEQYCGWLRDANSKFELRLIERTSACWERANHFSWAHLRAIRIDSTCERKHKRGKEHDEKEHCWRDPNQKTEKNTAKSAVAEPEEFLVLDFLLHVFTRIATLHSSVMVLPAEAARFLRLAVCEKGLFGFYVF
jgi:hypothetical protein